MNENGRAQAWEALRGAVVQAAQAGALETPEGRQTVAKLLIQPLVPKWGKAPEEARCQSCGEGGLERSFILAGGPFSGMVHCPSCGHQQSVMSQIAKTLITVEPLPESPIENREKCRRSKP